MMPREKKTAENETESTKSTSKTKLPNCIHLLLLFTVTLGGGTSKDLKGLRQN